MRHSSLLLVSTLALAAACAGAPDTPPSPGAPATGSVDPAVARACPDAPSLAATGATACTQMGCYDGYEIEVTPSEAWPAGDYRYIVELDGRTVTCTGSLPLQPCGTASMTCDGEGVSITESGCALQPAQHAFGGVSIPELPQAVHLRIEHDGASLVDQALTAKYATSQPNGPGCGPICCQGGDAVSLSFATSSG